MTAIETLSKCREQFPFYSDFLDRCIFEYTRGADTKLVLDIEQFVNILKALVDNNGKFYGDTPSIILAYRRRMKI